MKSHRGRPKKTKDEISWAFAYERKAKLESRHCIKQIYSIGKGSYTNIKKPAIDALFWQILSHLSSDGKCSKAAFKDINTLKKVDGLDIKSDLSARFDT